MEFGEKLYRLRIARGVYQKQLAAYLHVSVGTVSNYENGIHFPDLRTLCKIADFFQVSVDYLLDHTEYIAPIEELNQSFIDQYICSDIMNAILELSPDGRADMVKFLKMRKLYDIHCQTSPEEYGADTKL